MSDMRICPGRDKCNFKLCPHARSHRYNSAMCSLECYESKECVECDLLEAMNRVAAEEEEK
jgi:hypothetical protein